MADKIPLKLTTGPNEIQEFAGSDTVGKPNLPNDTVYLATAQALANKTLSTSTQVTSLRANAINGPVVVNVTGAGLAGAENDHIRLSGQNAGAGAIVAADHITQPNVDLRLQAKGTGKVLVGANGEVIGATGSQTLTNKILTQPAIGDFTNAGHTHLNAAGGGTLSASSIAVGTMSQDRLADQANRITLYSGGAGGRVLTSSSTAGGSNGTAEWTEREKLAQLKVQTASYSGSPVNNPNWVTLSVGALQSSENGWNSLPDVYKESATQTPFTYQGGASVLGKVFKMTACGTCTTVGASRSIGFRIKDGLDTYFETGYIFAGSTFQTSDWILEITAVYTGGSSLLGNFHWFANTAKVLDRTGVTPTVNEMTEMFKINSSVGFVNGLTTNWQFQASLYGTANAGDSINCHACNWEILN